MVDSIKSGAASMATSQAAGAVGGVGGELIKAAGGLLVGAMMAGGRRDPDVAFMYHVEIDSVALGMFTECTGIKWTMETEGIKEGGNNNHELNLLGRAKFSPLVLKRGFVGKDSYLFDMMHRTFDPNLPVYRSRICCVVHKRSKGGYSSDVMGTNEVGRVTFYNAFVQEWEGPSFGSSKNEVAVESITFKYDYLEFHPGSPGEQLLHAAATGAMSAGVGKMLKG